MSDLRNKIAAYDEQKKQDVPAEILATMDKATQDLRATGIEDRAVKDGRKAPGFSLTNHVGEERTLDGFLAKGPVVLSFYRGGWCPYCNMELAALQRALPEIEALGAQLVAVSPETPDHSLSTREKHDLAFEVLFDKGNKVAQSYGLVFVLDEALRPLYAKLGIDLVASNGDDSFSLPIPATYVIDRNGVVAYHLADADYTKRLEPDDVISALKKL